MGRCDQFQPDEAEARVRLQRHAPPQPPSHGLERPGQPHSRMRRRRTKKLRLKLISSQIRTPKFWGQLSLKIRPFRQERGKNCIIVKSFTRVFSGLRQVFLRARSPLPGGFLSRWDKFARVQRAEPGSAAIRNHVTAGRSLRRSCAAPGRRSPPVPTVPARYLCGSRGRTNCQNQKEAGKSSRPP